MEDACVTKWKIISEASSLERNYNRTGIVLRRPYKNQSLQKLRSYFHRKHEEMAKSTTEDSASRLSSLNSWFTPKRYLHRTSLLYPYFQQLYFDVVFLKVLRLLSISMVSLKWCVFFFVWSFALFKVMFSRQKNLRFLCLEIFLRVYG